MKHTKGYKERLEKVWDDSYKQDPHFVFSDVESFISSLLQEILTEIEESGDIPDAKKDHCEACNSIVDGFEIAKDQDIAIIKKYL